MDAPSYSRKNFYAMIGNLRRSGLLRRVKVNENTAVQLTPKGLSELINRYGHAGLAGEKWDGRWRLVLGRLGEEVPQVRFGLFAQGGIYLSVSVF